MPQLNPEFFLSQLFWLVVTFSFLLFFLWKVSLPRISSVLEKRENKINNDIKTAKQLQIEAEKIQDQILEQRIEAQKIYKIESTPTILIIEKKYSDKVDYKKFKKIIEKNL